LRLSALCVGATSNHGTALLLPCRPVLSGRRTVRFHTLADFSDHVTTPLGRCQPGRDSCHVAVQGICSPRRSASQPAPVPASHGNRLTAAPRLSARRRIATCRRAGSPPRDIPTRSSAPARAAPPTTSPTQSASQPRSASMSPACAPRVMRGEGGLNHFKVRATLPRARKRALSGGYRR